MKSWKYSLASIVFIMVGGLLFSACLGRQSTPIVSPESAPATTIDDTSSTVEVESDQTTGTSEVKVETTPGEESVAEIVVEGGSMKFSPTKITVSQGQKVTIRFKNVQGFHDFVIDEFNVKTEQIAAGEEAVVSFVADKKGTFEYYCSVANHRQLGMKGTLIVQ